MSNPHPKPLPPTELGNTRALTHGGYSESAITERAALVSHHLMDLCPWLAEDPAYVIAVARFVRVEARSQLLGEAIAMQAAERGILKIGARLLEAAAQTDRLSAKLGDDLGISPLGKARLKAETAQGELGEAALVGLAETGAAIRKRRAKAIEAEKEENDDHETEPT